MDNGFFLNHYLLAAALFVFCRSLCTTRIRPTGGLSRLLGRLSGLVFGVYWVHVLILYVLTDLVGQELSILAFIALRWPSPFPSLSPFLFGSLNFLSCASSWGRT